MVGLINNPARLLFLPLLGFLISFFLSLNGDLTHHLPPQKTAFKRILLLLCDPFRPTLFYIDTKRMVVHIRVFNFFLVDQSVIIILPPPKDW